MNKEDFTFIGCRLLALYFSVKAFYSVSYFVMTWIYLKDKKIDSFPDMSSLAYLNLIPFLGYVLVAIIFWFFARQIVNFILPVKINDTDRNKITLTQVQSVAFSSVGILIFLSALPEMGGVLYKIHLSNEMDSYAPVSFDTRVEILELTIKLLLGFLLFLGAKLLSRLLSRFRYAGIK